MVNSMRNLTLKALVPLLSVLGISVIAASGGYAGTDPSSGETAAYVSAAPEAPQENSTVPQQPQTNVSPQHDADIPVAHETNSEPKTGSPQPSLQQRNPYYSLRINDLFEVSFPFSPEFNETVRVPPDGWVPLVGARPVHIAGETVPQAIAIIRKAYTGILHDPEILVLLKEFEKPYFIVSGQVGKPGKYDLLGDTTVTQAVAIAGGFNKDAKHSQVVLFRRVADNWTEADRIDVKNMLNRKDLAEDPRLRPGDMLYVPKNSMSKIKDYLPNYGTGLYSTMP